MRDDGFVEFPKVKRIASFALDLLAEPVDGHAPYKVSAELDGGLFGADDLEASFAFSLKGTVHEEMECFVVGHLSAVHFVIEDRVGNRPEIVLKLGQAKRGVTISVTLIEHHLLGVDGPAFNEHTGSQYRS